MHGRHSSPARRWAVPSLGLVAGMTLASTLACIPSYPPCDCEKDEAGSGPEDFPDFEYLDRSEPCAESSEICIEGSEGVCGYPAGEYGYQPGDTFPNLELFDCEGNMVQMAQYIPQACTDNETRGVVFAVGAGWCAPCQEEAIEWAEHFIDEYEPMGIQFLQALDEDAGNAVMTPAFCAGWSGANAQDKFPILYTVEKAELQATMGGPNTGIPYTLIFNANGEIVFKKTDGKVDTSVLEGVLGNLISDPYGN